MTEREQRGSHADGGRKEVATTGAAPFVQELFLFLSTLLGMRLCLLAVFCLGPGAG